MSRRHPASDDTEPSFIRRWSRRKAGVEDPAAADDEPRIEPANGSPDSGEVSTNAYADEPAREPPEVKTDEDMPDLDSLTDASDMSDFLSPGVSEALRNQALRRLFRMSKFNVTDGLDDYCEDFRTFGALGDMVTSDMRHRMEMAQQERDQEADGDSVDRHDAGSRPENDETARDEVVEQDLEETGEADSEEPGESTDGEAKPGSRT